MKLHQRSILYSLACIFLTACAAQATQVQLGEGRPQATVERATPELLVTPITGATSAPADLEVPAIAPAQPVISSPATPPTVDQLCSPLKDHSLAELPQIISDPYHPPPMGKDDRHQGVDFSYYRRGERESIAGVEIQSVLSGRVAASITDSFPFGNLLIIETPGEDLPPELQQEFSIQAGQSLYLLYAHMQAAPSVKPGEAVQACQVLGQVGKSGNAGVAHLHLEVRRGPENSQFPVFGYYRPSNTPQERKAYLLWRTSGVFQHFDPMALFD